MRTIFTLRFLASLLAVAGLAGAVYLLFGSGDSVAEVVEEQQAPRRIDLVSLVFFTETAGFEFDDGTIRGDLDLILGLNDERTVHIVDGTPGASHCDELDQPAACAVVLDLLGEGVVWFDILPVGRALTVEMPAIVSLDSGVATLENGWQVPYAPILERTCSRDFDSFRQFSDVLDTDFVSLYSLVEARLTEVVCLED